MPTDPLTPEQVNALLRPDPRTTAADLLVLRDALRRLGDAWERLASAAGKLENVARTLDGRAPGAGPAPGSPGGPRDAERPRARPPRAD